MRAQREVGGWRIASRLLAGYSTAAGLGSAVLARPGEVIAGGFTCTTSYAGDTTRPTPRDC